MPRPLLIVLLAGPLAVSCASPAPKGSAAAEPPARSAPVTTPTASLSPRADAFNESRAWTHLEALCAIGPRTPGTSGHERGLAYAEAHFRTAGAVVRRLPFQATAGEPPQPYSLVNLVASFGPGHGPWVLVGAHHDTRPFADRDPDSEKRHLPILGANDGASGVAVLLEIGTILAQQPPAHGVVLVMFDGEDLGREGSNDYFKGSRDLAGRLGEIFPAGPPTAGIVIDMVGDSDLRFLRETAAEQANAWLNDLVWDAGTRRRAASFAPHGTLPVLDDHRALLDVGVPMAHLIDFTYPPWHTTDDTSAHCSPGSLGLTGRVVLDVFADHLPARP